MGLEFLLQDQPFVHDLYTIGDPSVVRFYCPGKHKTVRAPLSGSFNLSVQSRWNGLFDGTGGGSQLLGIIDSFAQALGNHTLSQPWFGRKLWGGTTPFKFSLPVRFVSRFDAYKEVFLPVMGLLSFMYPRLVTEVDEESERGVANALSMYFVPGPNVFYALGDEEGGLGAGNGDRVEISMGSFLNFTGCYLTSINLTVENSFNLAGYPHNVGAQVDFEAMDASFVGVDGSFMERGLGNQAFKMNEELKAAMETAQKAVEDGGNGIMDAVNSFKNALKSAV
jgi:hypothetical protein